MPGKLQLDWQERWVSPGICLLARCRVNNRGVLGAVANSMMTPSGIWAFVNGGSACLLDAPYAWEDANDVLPTVQQFVDQHNLRVSCVSCSHLHLDHSAGLSSMLHAFPHARFVFPQLWPQHWRSVSADRIKCGLQRDLSNYWDGDRSRTYSGHWATSLDGEPLHFIEAPYHSPTDQLVVFRGVAVLPDWHLADRTSDRLQQVNASREQIRNTLRRLRKFESENGHRIHSRIAVHGDEPLEHDFRDRIETTCGVFYVA
jgi:glyoxylase-like metal-dependent hydrolase (beta-lactamase superfamily II)